MKTAIHRGTEAPDATINAGWKKLLWFDETEKMIKEYDETSGEWKLLGFVKLNSLTAQLIESDILVPEEKFFQFRLKNGTSFPIAQFEFLLDEDGSGYKIFALGGENSPLMLRYAAKGEDGVIHGKRIRVLYTDENDTSHINDSLALYSDVSPTETASTAELTDTIVIEIGGVRKKMTLADLKTLLA